VPIDLLIATAAIVDDAALATHNVKDLSRVPGPARARVLSGLRSSAGFPIGRA